MSSIDIQVRPASYEDVQAFRELYRQEANCQIIHDSFLARGLADAYLIMRNGRPAGYAAVGNTYPNGQLTEFYTLPPLRAFALPLFREVLAVSGATHIEAQTNMPLMLSLLYDCAKHIVSDALLFGDAFTTQLAIPNAVFRRATPDDASSVFPHYCEPVGDWVLVVDDIIVGTGGFLSHYNPPYADLYMEVSVPARRRGYGSYLVQEVKRVCYEAGRKPAARCNNPNDAVSRQTLQKAGFLPCGRLLVGEVDPFFAKLRSY